MTQFEFYKSFLFVIELLLAEMMYVHRFTRRALFPLRLAVGISACFLFAWLFPILSDNAFYCSFMFLMIFAFTMLMCKFVFNANWLTVAFCCLAGYTTQHLSYEIYDVLVSVLNISDTSGFYGGAEFTGIFPNLFVFAMYLLIYVFAYSLCYLFFARKIKVNEQIEIKSSFIFIFSILLVIVDVFLNAIVVYFPIENAQLYRYIISAYNVLCCCISLYLQFEVAVRRRLEVEFEFMQQLWDKTKEQYTFAKENIELINMKCHDFKHQIRTIRTAETINPEVLQELEGYINIYDSITKTGNEALDVILTEKSLLCNKNNVQFTYIVDGDKLNFMHEEDVYALFGNIVDNAIEATMQVEESKRIINLHVKMVNDMLVIRENNYYVGDLQFENGLPKTTKQDDKYHGFGLKSIKYVTEKYGGSYTLTADDGVFELNIVMFPFKR